MKFFLLDNGDLTLDFFSDSSRANPTNFSESFLPKVGI